MQYKTISFDKKTLAYFVDRAYFKSDRKIINFKYYFMENSKNKSFSELLIPEKQTQVLENVINKGLYDNVPALAKDGYAFNIFIFDLLRVCGKTDVLEQVWNTDFHFRGHVKSLLSFVALCKGEEDAARFIAKRREDISVWNSCYSYFTDNMLEAVEDWNALVSRGRADILARHERYDDIINNYSRLASCHGFQTARMLKERNLMQRIVRLKQYDWLLTPEWLPEGAQHLIETGKMQKVVAHFRHSKTLPEAARTICNSLEGRELLRRAGLYEWLYDAGYPQYMADDGKWLQLAEHGRFDLINWTRVTDKCHRKRIVSLAVKNEEWNFLLKTRQYRALLKQGKFKPVLKHIMQNPVLGQSDKKPV